MKIEALIILVVLNIVSNNCTQDEFIGVWQYSGKNRIKKTIECPDLIVFKTNSEYYIINDCETHIDNKTGCHEKGDWNYNSEKKYLVLKNRMFENRSFSNYVFYSGNDALTFEVNKLTTDTLLITIISESDTIKNELYLKRKDWTLSDMQDTLDGVR